MAIKYNDKNMLKILVIFPGQFNKTRNGGKNQCPFCFFYSFILFISQCFSWPDLELQKNWFALHSSFCEVVGPMDITEKIRRSQLLQLV